LATAREQEHESTQNFFINCCRCCCRCFWHSAAFCQGTTTFTFTQLDVPGTCYTEADDINVSGDIIVFFVDSPGSHHGFLFQHATFTQLDFPGATATRTAGINNSGVIAGSFTDAAGVQHGLVGRPGAFTRFDFPGSTSTLGLSINDAGEIAGAFNDAAGLTPCLCEDWRHIHAI
jgi:uncharacterized membrane protein